MYLRRYCTIVQSQQRNRRLRRISETTRAQNILLRTNISRQVISPLVPIHSSGQRTLAGNLVKNKYYKTHFEIASSTIRMSSYYVPYREVLHGGLILKHVLSDTTMLPSFGSTIECSGIFLRVMEEIFHVLAYTRNPNVSPLVLAFLINLVRKW